MSQFHAPGHHANCGCPVCVRHVEAHAPSVGSLVSRASDGEHGPHCNCAGCRRVENTVTWRAVLDGEVEGA